MTAGQILAAAKALHAQHQREFPESTPWDRLHVKFTWAYLMHAYHALKAAGVR